MGDGSFTEQLVRDPNFPYLAAATSGLVAHAVFKRHEPSLYRFLSILASGVALAGYAASDVAEATILVLVSLSTLSASIAFYRLVLHPLAGIPGPLLGRLTQLHTYLIVVEGQTRRRMRALHAKYGDIVRIGACGAHRTESPILIASS
jgi:hypothetical protein